MTKLRINFFEGNTEELLVLGEAQISDSYQKQSNAVVRVLRDEWSDFVSLIDKLNDEFYIEVDGSDVFGGRLVTYDNKNEIVQIELASFEEDAIDAKPAGDAELLGSDLTDAEVVNEAIDRVDTLSAGQIDQIESGLRVILANESPADIIRSMQRVSGAFVYYRPDKTVDYIEATESAPNITVGPTYSNVQDKFNVVENEREEYTHVRVLGASEGSSRVRATAVVDSYDGTGRTRWQRYPDKDITSQDYADVLAQNLINEYNTNPIRKKVETVIFGEDIQVGDRVAVESSRNNIDDVLWVVESTKLLDGVQNVFDVVLSNRLLTQEEKKEKERRDVQKFNQGFQGDIITLSAGGYRASVDSDSVYRFVFQVPDSIRKIITAEVLIEGLPYRDESGGNVTESSSDTPDSVGIRMGQNPSELNLVGGSYTGEFKETEDISRYISPGINYIEADSDALGDIRMTAYLFGYSQVTE